MHLKWGLLRKWQEVTAIEAIISKRICKKRRMVTVRPVARLSFSGLNKLLFFSWHQWKINLNYKQKFSVSFGTLQKEGLGYESNWQSWKLWFLITFASSCPLKHSTFHNWTGISKSVIFASKKVMPGETESKSTLLLSLLVSYYEIPTFCSHL